MVHVNGANLYTVSDARVKLHRGITVAALDGKARQAERQIAESLNRKTREFHHQ